MQTVVSMLGGAMVSKRYVSYLRVSTPKQGENGLGVEAQREAVRRYLLSHEGEQITEFVEVETGKRSDRPQLAAAMALAQRRKAHIAHREARSALPQRRVYFCADGFKGLRSRHCRYARRESFDASCTRRPYSRAYSKGRTLRF